MSFFTDASFVMDPNVYGVGKLYVPKPTDGSGDLTFSRASTGTRVNQDGLIEKVRTNVLLQSNSFDTTWANVSSTETSGQAGYDGTNNAWLLTKTAGNGRVEQSISASGSLTFSVYAKANANDWILLRADTTGGVRTSYFNISSGAIGVSAICTPAIESAGNGYYRCSISFNDSVSIFRIYVGDSNGSSLGTSGNILIQSAQVETGDIATDYIPTTTSAVSVGPLANIPRLNYGSDGCPSLLLEPQRTNSITSSESTATGWTFTNSSSAVNQTTSPDGYVNADSIIPDATSGQHAINSANITASGSFTLSAFVKAGEYTKVAIRESANTGSYASFNLATGTKIEDNVSGASFIQSYGNGWYRIGVTGTYSGSIRLGINLLSNAYTTGNPSSGTTFFAGNGTDKLFCWGMQCELNATYATSYIGPTLGASVTRLGDSASKTGISSLIGQTEGTLFVEFEYNGLFPNVDTPFVILGTYVSNYIAVAQYNANMYARIVAGGVTQGTFGFGVLVVGQTYKCAIAYSSAGFVFYVNGSLAGSNLSATIPATSVFNTTRGNFENSKLISQALLFKTRLSNADLARLTSL